MDAREIQEKQEIQSITGGQWKDLCKELGLRQSGRKDEARVRVMEFLRSPEGQRRASEVGRSPLIHRVMELLHLPKPAPRPVSGQFPPPTEPPKTCVCGGIVQVQVINCSRCGSPQHRNCMGKSAFMQDFECPMCQFRQIEPYEQIVEVILPPSLTSSIGLNTVQRQFTYTEDMHRKLQERGKRRLLQIRCIRLDEEGFTYHWPLDCTVLLNGKSIFSFTKPSASSSRKRKDTSLMISGLGIGYNQAMVIKQKEEDVYVFGIFIVEVRTAETVAAELSAAHVLSAEGGKAFVRGRVGGSDEVLTDSYRQSLKCPLTRLIPEVPVRGLKCQHIQCFDLRSYVVMQEKARTNRWRCPICNSLVLHLVVDQYMQEIVARAASANCGSVEFSADGGYTLVPDSDNEADDFSDRETIGTKRFAPPPVDLPVKKPALQLSPSQKLVWGQFAHSKIYADQVTPDMLHSTLCYQKAIQKSQKSLLSVAPRTEVRASSVRPAASQHGKSMSCPIEIED